MKILLFVIIIVDLLQLFLLFKKDDKNIISIKKILNPKKASIINIKNPLDEIDI